MRAPGIISFSLLALSSLAVAQFPGSTAPPAAWKTGYDSINTSDGKSFLGFLAGPECQGRGTGQPGFQKAADYMAAHFKQFGLKPVGDNGTYFQGVPFWRSFFVDKGSYLKIGRTGEILDAGDNFRLANLTKNLDVNTTVVEVNPTDPFPAVDAETVGGKIVILTKETNNMRSLGAIFRANPAVILTVRKAVGPTDYSIRRTAPNANAPARPASGTISEAAFARLTRDATWNDSKPGIRVSQGLVRLVANVQSEDIKVPNVVGLLEGSDPTLKAEIVGIGSHLDHLGVSGGVVYPGADDDGSGSTALLQVAKAFSVSPTKPKRSILFMAFCGEEMGLIGSGFYSDNPIFPHDRMIAELQMDMVGRRSSGAQNGDPNRIDKAEENIDTIRLVGSKRISTDLDKTIMEANKSVNFRFKYDAEDVYTRSDHYNFARQGIPIAFFFTGFHPEYHQPTDTIEKIDFDKIANTAKLVFLTANMMADNPQRPVKDVKESNQEE